MNPKKCKCACNDIKCLDCQIQFCPRCKGKCPKCERSATECLLRKRYMKEVFDC